MTVVEETWPVNGALADTFTLGSVWTGADVGIIK